MKREKPDLDGLIARRLAEERAARDLTLEDLAHRSGVSRAMISRVERGESSPTAAVLGRLCAGLGITLSSLFAALEPAASPIARARQQPVWRDPATGYVRRAVSPPNTGSVQDIVDVTLPPRARVAYPAASYRGIDQHVLVLEGELEFGNGADVHRLDAGDCLHVQHVADSWFRNPGRRVVRYLVVLARVANGATPGRARGVRR
jgi:transcriptional regulator with XRE-family HTH domain